MSILVSPIGEEVLVTGHQVFSLADGGRVEKGVVGRIAANGGRPLATDLTGTAEALGPGDADGSGSAALTLNQGQGEISFSISVADIALPATGAHQPHLAHHPHS